MQLSKLFTGKRKSWLLLALALAGFAAILVLAPVGRQYPLLALVLLFGMLGLFKLLGQFEQRS